MQQHDEWAQGKSAASALYDRYASSIFAYARLYTPSWEDVTLGVFAAALTERQQLVWLRRVAHNKRVDRYRRSVHLSVIPSEQVKETVRTEEALTAEQMVLRGEELERLYKAASTLSFFQQQVLQLRFGEGLRFAEIAVLLNKREATVRKLCSRSIVLLRTIYEQQ
jgi:RNA polymerase sigma factor (sigma-70 family)